MSPDPHQPDPTAEIAFVQQALLAADKSQQRSRITVAVLSVLAVVTFVWMHLHLLAPQTLGQLLHALLRVDLFFLVLMFAMMMYLRQAMNQNTRTILRALANTRKL